MPPHQVITTRDQRRLDQRSQRGLTVEVVRRQYVLEPEYVIRREKLTHADGRVGVPRHVRVDHQPSIRPHDLASTGGRLLRDLEFGGIPGPPVRELVRGEAHLAVPLRVSTGRVGADRPLRPRADDGMNGHALRLRQQVP